MHLLNETGEGSMLVIAVEDPAGHDNARDPVVVTTRRGLSRIAFVAAEAASRFEREGISYDPMAWMMTPRSIFDGSAAIDACLSRKSFLRAAILHGLSLGLDAQPEEIDPLIGHDEQAAQDEPPGRGEELLSVNMGNIRIVSPNSFWVNGRPGFCSEGASMPDYRTPMRYTPCGYLAPADRVKVKRPPLMPAHSDDQSVAASRATQAQL